MEGDEHALETAIQNVDVIVYGSDLVQSILACALANAGKKVLLLDGASYYGGLEACLPVSQLVDPSLLSHLHAPLTLQKSSSDTWQLLPVDARPANVGWQLDAQDEWKQHVREIDLMKTPILARDALVEALIRSGVSAYTHFMPMPRPALFSSPSNIHLVPGSKEDVFMDESIGLLEKRKYMKVMQALRDDTIADQAEYLLPWLDEMQLSKQQTEMLLYGLLRSSSASESLHITKGDARKRLSIFVNSVGRYGGSFAYLLPEYSFADLGQGFCRRAAVRGATVMLHANIDMVDVSLDKVQVRLKDEGQQRIWQAPVCILPARLLQQPEQERESDVYIHHRAVCVTSDLPEAIMHMGTGSNGAPRSNLWCLILPPHSELYPSPLSIQWIIKRMLSIKDSTLYFYIHHLSAVSSVDECIDLKAILARLIETLNMTTMMRCFIQERCFASSSPDTAASMPPSLKLTHSLPPRFTYDEQLEHLQGLFSDILGSESTMSLFPPSDPSLQHSDDPDDDASYLS